MALLRFFDTEAYDSARVREHIWKFANQLDWAFTRGNIVTKPGTYTHMMLERLCRARTAVVRGAPVTVGTAESSVPQPVIQACLARLNSYVVLAVATLRAEFPEWELLQSFSIFDLDGSLAHAPDTDAHFRRLAQVFGIHRDQLIQQHRNYRVQDLRQRRDHRH